jgi:surface-anchored protein
MKLLWIPIGLLPIAASHAGLMPLREHVDLHWHYDPVDAWVCEARTGQAGQDVMHELSEVYLPIGDEAVEDGGERYSQPDLGEFAFTGVAAGKPIWISPQIQEPGQVWPGFNNDQTAENFGSYQETDPRLPAEDRAMSQPWIQIRFHGLSYLGTGEPAFSMWKTDGFGTPTPWFSTAAGQNTFIYVAGSHVHANWGFGALGIYRIRMSASAYQGPGQTSPTGESDIFTVTFAVGLVAQWQADHFTGAELEDAAVSGLAADPDGDGLTNLQEFAFGMDPRDGQRMASLAGLGLPKHSLRREAEGWQERFEYPRRKALGQLKPLRYQPEISVNLSDAGWAMPADVLESVHEISGDAAHLAEQWEWVELQRTLPAGPPERRFWRLGVTQDP